jgi:hypothetical protein
VTAAPLAAPLPAPPATDARRMNRRRALLHGLTFAGLAFLVFLFAVMAPRVGSFGYDAFAYWHVDAADPYRLHIGALGSFTYSPAAVLVSAQLGRLPWWQFVWLWEALLIGTVVWLGGRRTLLLLAFPFVALELYHGNIHLLLAAAIVLGFRHPWTWSFVLLTKSTCGVGLLWFVVRREWRPLAIALGTAAALAGISWLVAPDLWAQWVAFLLQSPGGTPGGPSVPVPLWVRLPIAAALVIWGARTDRRWTVLVGSMIALPVLWFTGFAMLAGLAAGLTSFGPGWRARPEGLLPGWARPSRMRP